MRIFNYPQLLLLIACVFASSCTTTKLSCDNDVNIWAKEHLATYLDATRSEIVSLPLSRQRAIYRGLSPEKKSSLWKAKISYLIECNLFTSEEKK